MHLNSFMNGGIRIDRAVVILRSTLNYENTLLHAVTFNRQTTAQITFR